MSSKDILIEQLGGENSYKILIKTYCNHIRDNEDLVPFFGHLNEESLMKLQEDLLQAAFAPDEGRGTRLHRRVRAHHRRLFDKGLDETHFDSLKEHFLDALNDFCIQDDCYESCNNDLDSLRYIFEEGAKRHARGGRFRRSSVGRGERAPEHDESIAGIPRRCSSLPAVSRKGTHMTVNGVNKNIQKGVIAVTRSGGEKLKSMFHASTRPAGVQQSNSGEMIRTMFNSNKQRQRHSGESVPKRRQRAEPVDRTGSGEKLKTMLNSVTKHRHGENGVERTGSGEKLKKRSGGDAVERSTSGEKLKAMFLAGKKKDHSDDGVNEGIKRTNSGDKLRAMLDAGLTRSGSGGRLKALLNPGMKHSNSGDILNEGMKRTGSGDRLKAMLGFNPSNIGGDKTSLNASFGHNYSGADAAMKRKSSADKLNAILNSGMKSSHSGNKLEVN